MNFQNKLKAENLTGRLKNTQSNPQARLEMMTDNEAKKLDRTCSQKAEQEGTSVAPKFSITGILLPATKQRISEEQMRLGLVKGTITRLPRSSNSLSLMALKK